MANGTEAGLTDTLERLAALLEPAAATVVWVPERLREPGGAVPDPRFQSLARRLIQAAAPRARVGVHCVGWQGELDHELRALARRFS